MNGLELLEEIKRLDTQILAKKVRRSEIAQDALMVSGISNDKDKVQTSNLSDRTAKGAVNLASLDAEIKGLEDRRAKYVAMIDKIAGAYSPIIKGKYLDEKPTSQLAVDFGLSPRRVRRTIRAGEVVLERFDKIGRKE